MKEGLYNNMDELNLSGVDYNDDTSETSTIYEFSTCSKDISYYLYQELYDQAINEENGINLRLRQILKDIAVYNEYFNFKLHYHDSIVQVHGCKELRAYFNKVLEILSEYDMQICNIEKAIEKYENNWDNHDIYLNDHIKQTVKKINEILGGIRSNINIEELVDVSSDISMLNESFKSNDINTNDSYYFAELEGKELEMAFKIEKLYIYVREFLDQSYKDIDIYKDLNNIYKNSLHKIINLTLYKFMYREVVFNNARKNLMILQDNVDYILNRLHNLKYLYGSESDKYLKKLSENLDILDMHIKLDEYLYINKLDNKEELELKEKTILEILEDKIKRNKNTYNKYCNEYERILKHKENWILDYNLSIKNLAILLENIRDAINIIKDINTPSKKEISQLKTLANKKLSSCKVERRISSDEDSLDLRDDMDNIMISNQDSLESNDQLTISLRNRSISMQDGISSLHKSFATSIICPSFNLSIDKNSNSNSASDDNMDSFDVESNKNNDIIDIVIDAYHTDIVIDTYPTDTVIGTDTEDEVIVTDTEDKVIVTNTEDIIEEPYTIVQSLNISNEARNRYASFRICRINILHAINHISYHYSNISNAFSETYIEYKKVNTTRFNLETINLSKLENKMYTTKYTPNHKLSLINLYSNNINIPKGAKIHFYHKKTKNGDDELHILKSEYMPIYNAGKNINLDITIWFRNKRNNVIALLVRLLKICF